MNRFFLILLCCFCCLPAFTTALKGGVSYTVEQARIEAFTGVPQKINILKYQADFEDKNFAKNMTAIKKKKFKFSDRRITLFNDDSYSVTYNERKNITYYYNKNGKLIFIEFNEIGNYPRKGACYNIKGVLDNTSLSVSPNNEFLFDSKGNLKAHWIGKNCYNEQGELIMTRK